MMQQLDLPLLLDECWWGGAIHDGTLMLFADESFDRDLHGDTLENQAMPLLLSNKGRYVWSEEPYQFSFKECVLHVNTRSGRIEQGAGYSTLQDVFRHVARTYFPPSGTYPDPLFFTVPQYSTWIEMLYEPTQAKVLRYTEDVLAHGMPPGVLIIDDNWQEDYGTWSFHPTRFPDPHAMVISSTRWASKLCCGYVPLLARTASPFGRYSSTGIFSKKKMERRPSVHGGMDIALCSIAHILAL